MGMQQDWQSLLKIDVTPLLVCESFEKQVVLIICLWCRLDLLMVLTVYLWC
jgi:hypothetical protein